MRQKNTSNNWLKILVVTVLILGIFLRFYNIDRKFYWFDETFTSLRVSGYTEAEVVKQVCNGEELEAGDLLKYQQLSPGKTVIDTIESLALEDSQHPPLYYSIAHFWVLGFGSSVATIRSLSAIISLMVIPCLYWVCLELFDSSVVGLVAIALIAVSPIHVLFAQETRQYSLWTLTTLLSSGFLLRAIRLNTKFSWIIYATSLAISFYTFLFSGFTAIGHFIYVAINERWQITRRLINYFIAFLLSILAFSPWIVIIVRSLFRFQETTRWISNSNYPSFLLIKTWLLNYSLMFIDIGSNFIEPLLLLIVIILGYSIFFLCKTTNKKAWLFIITSIGTTSLPLIAKDIIMGGVTSIIPKYSFPSYLGVNLAVAYLIATKITTRNFKKQLVWRILLVVLLTSSILSSTIISQAKYSWLKSGSHREPVIPETARIINQADNPLVISSCHGIWPVNHEISLSHLLDRRVKLQLIGDSNVAKIPSNFNNIFLFGTSLELQTSLQKKDEFQIEIVQPEKLRLLKLTRK